MPVIETNGSLTCLCLLVIFIMSLCFYGLKPVFVYPFLYPFFRGFRDTAGHYLTPRDTNNRRLIKHPLDAALKPELQAKFNVGDSPRGGDSYTVTATAGGDNQTSGGSFKIIIDTEDWDTVLGLNNPGQSGDVNDPHYRDLYELWSAGKYFPVFYTRKKVESVTEKRVHLSPRAKSSTARVGY